MSDAADTARRILDFDPVVQDGHPMTARTITDEQEKRIARIIFSYGCYGFNDQDWTLLMLRKRTKKTETPQPKPNELDRAFAIARQISALLSTSASDQT